MFIPPYKIIPLGAPDIKPRFPAKNGRGTHLGCGIMETLNFPIQGGKGRDSRIFWTLSKQASPSL
jgi:hypothetical protein